MAVWEEANPERYREGRRKKQKRFWDTHPEYRARQKMRWAELKETVLDHYGRVCACCGATENLSIDHLDGDGAAHRIEMFGNRNATGQRTYQWLVDQGFPGGFQVLCVPCNGSKGSGPRCKLHNPQPHCPTCSCYL